MSIGYSEDKHEGVYEQTPKWIRLLDIEEGSEALREAVLNELFPDDPTSNDTSFLGNPDKTYRQLRGLVIGKAPNPHDAAEILKTEGVLGALGQGGWMSCTWELICQMPLEVKIDLAENPTVNSFLRQYNISEQVMRATLTNWRRGHDLSAHRTHPKVALLAPSVVPVQ